MDLMTHAPASGDGRETGGIVLGVDMGLGGDVVVRRCGDAGPRSVRNRNRFSRDVVHAQQLADAAYAHDGSTWVGEWHTHLVDLPTPSSTDLRTFRKLLADPETGLARVIALIVLADLDAGWKRPVVHAWSFTGSVLRELPIRVVEEPDTR